MKQSVPELLRSSDTVIRNAVSVPSIREGRMDFFIRALMSNIQRGARLKLQPRKQRGKKRRLGKSPSEILKYPLHHHLTDLQIFRLLILHIRNAVAL